jgi:hypothetical protein
MASEVGLQYSISQRMEEMWEGLDERGEGRRI